MATEKIVLNFHHYSAQQVRDMGNETLESAGFVPSDADPTIGDQLPDGTVYAGVSPDTGKTMYTTPADAPLAMKFNEAADYAAKLDAHGHQDWRMPTKAELNVVFNNCAAIGGFSVSGSNPAVWYWSASQYGRWDAWGQRFSDGAQSYGLKSFPSSVRCVR